MTDPVKNGTDLVAVLGGFASYLDYAPNIAAVLSVIWLTIRISEWLWRKFKDKQS